MHDTENIHKQNNFGLIRLLAAIAVVLSHSWLAVGFKTQPLFHTTGYDDLGNLAVRVFFVISGFLITKSWLSEPDLKSYFVKRFLRIYPAAMVCTVLTVIFLGLYVTTLPFQQYLIHPETISYLKRNLLLLQNIQLTLPGVFLNNPYPKLVNGPLWTLVVELKLYILVALCGLFRILSKRAVLLIATIALASYLLFFTGSYNPLNKLWLAAFFMVGMLYHLYGEKIVFNRYVALILFAILLFSFKTALYPLLSFLVLPYLVFSVAYFPLPTFFHTITKHDLSYGIYIYAWPIQQTLVYFLHNSLNPWLLFALSLATVLPIAALSWFMIEKPALGLKSLMLRQQMPFRKLCEV